MLKTKSPKYIILLLFSIGIIFRLSLFIINPSSNSYDDHKEPISLYAQSLKRPLPDKCWECYQPPAYYILSASIYKLSDFAGFSDRLKWKLVQLINPTLSILVLFLFYFIISEIGATFIYKLLYLSFIIVLPRDVFTSAMITNDYLLVFSSIAALLYYIKCVKYLNNENRKQLIINYVLLTIFTLLACYSKQHGILLIILPIAVTFLYFLKNKLFTTTILLPILFCTILLSLSEGIRNYKLTGDFIVSNQHLFNRAKEQFPGTLANVEFSSFRILSLLQQPFISYSTAASFPAELFASTFFDYEYKFLTPRYPLAIFTGRIAYLLGSIWLLYFITTTIIWFRNKLNSPFTIKSLNQVAPLLLALLFIAVPLLQTIRFPHYSSMKSTFMLPGIIILIALHVFISKEIKIQPKLTLSITILNILFALLLLFTLYRLTTLSIHNPVPIFT